MFKHEIAQNPRETFGEKSSQICVIKKNIKKYPNVRMVFILLFLFVANGCVSKTTYLKKETELKEMTQQFKKKSKEKENVQEKYTDTLKEVNEKAKEISEKAKEIDKLKEKEKGLEVELSVANKQISNMSRNRDELIFQKNKLSTKLQQITEEHDISKREQKQLRKEKKNLKREVLAIKNRLIEQETLLAVLETEKNQMENIIKAIKKLLSSFETSEEDMRAGSFEVERHTEIDPPQQEEEEKTKTILGRPGLKYEDIIVGSGRIAMSGHTVKVHYVGWTNGTKFDSSRDIGVPFSFLLGGGRVIKGWDEGLVGMKVGGKRKLVIPPELGYGSSGNGRTVPPNATLIYEVELLDVR